ncbi:hypothetical protein TNCV_2787171 [Trichonephila clavipes]|nr:hypothetical protein TNCV_2787171 [Trichonephila clavipes]
MRRDDLSAWIGEKASHPTIVSFLSTVLLHSQEMNGKNRKTKNLAVVKRSMEENKEIHKEK